METKGTQRVMIGEDYKPSLSPEGSQSRKFLDVWLEAYFRWSKGWQWQSDRFSEFAV